MQIYKTKKDLQNYLSIISSKKLTIGFVPTMGALHKGHLSLVKKAQLQNNIVIACIFVNPTQFNNAKDLVKYPKTLENDISLLESVNCNVLFVPTVDEIYAKNVVSDTFNFEGLESVMEGAFREGHFNGVATIVKRLFEIIQPTSAYFGEKDFQQLQIIKKLVKDSQIPVNVEGCAVFRENDGLAMSSRNLRLSKKNRTAAPFIYKTLKKAKEKFYIESVLTVTDWVKTAFENHSDLKLEYFTIANPETLQEINKKEDSKKHRAFIAVFADEIRLIDTIEF
jgi:pantoate--beta-alanine ligase